MLGLLRARSTTSARRSSWSPTTPSAAAIADRVIFLGDGGSSTSTRGCRSRTSSITSRRRSDPARPARIARAQAAHGADRVAVMLGVAMIAGTYVQTDRIRNAFEDITEPRSAGVDAVVTAERASRATSSQPELLDERVVDRSARSPAWPTPRASSRTSGRSWSTARPSAFDGARRSSSRPSTSASAPRRRRTGAPPARRGRGRDPRADRRGQGSTSATVRRGHPRRRQAGDDRRHRRVRRGPSIGGATIVVPPPAGHAALVRPPRRGLDRSASRPTRA